MANTSKSKKRWEFWVSKASSFMADSNDAVPYNIHIHRVICIWFQNQLDLGNCLYLCLLLVIHDFEYLLSLFISFNTCIFRHFWNLKCILCFFYIQFAWLYFISSLNFNHFFCFFCFIWQDKIIQWRIQKKRWWLFLIKSKWH